VAEIAVELAKQGITVFLSPVSQLDDEGFHLFAGSIAKSFHAAEIGGVSLDQIGIELKLADDLAGPIANRKTAISVERLGRQLLPLLICLGRFSDGPNLFD